MILRVQYIIRLHEVQQYLFQQMHNLIFIYNKLGLHVSAYPAIIRTPITKNTKNTAGQNK
jgi:hypothetical protein